jgi:nickel-dependent lactate racemase
MAENDRSGKRMPNPRIEIPYGSEYLNLEVAAGSLIDVVRPRKTQAASDPEGVVERALKEPIGLAFPVLSENSRITIVVDDATRVTPTKTLLSVLLRRLYHSGAKRDRITVSVANGLHEPADQETLLALLGEHVMQEYRVVNHNPREPSNLAYVGETKRGTPVDVNIGATRANIRILTGIIEPHQLAGYSGGVKALVPGLASVRTVTANHSLMLDERVHAGNIQDNPLRDDLEEAVSLTHSSGQNFIVNSIVNDERQIVDVVAGDEIQAHRKGVGLSREISSHRIETIADVVIASPGGYPRDINLYQSQKALGHTEQIIAHGGVAVLVAECRNGIGSKTCEEWMERDAEPAQLIQRLKNEGFNMGAHKAYQLARFMVKANLILVSKLPPELTKKMHLHTSPSMREAYREALEIAGRDARVIVCPHAAATLPIL